MSEQEPFWKSWPDQIEVAALLPREVYVVLWFQAQERNISVSEIVQELCEKAAKEEKKMANAFDELFTEAGDVAETALQRLVGLFGPTGGEIVHGIITALAAATAPAQPAAPAAPAAASESAFNQTGA